MIDPLCGIEVARGEVSADWIDVNDHMNVAYYLLAFDRAVDDLWERIGITADYIRETRGSTFAVESHVTWQRELKKGDPYIVTAQVLAFDEKRIHQFQRLYHGDAHYIAATAEWMSLHVNLDQRRVSPWPAATIEALHEVVAEQGALALPAEAGRRMRIRAPLGTTHADYERLAAE